jgi:hypothetical protein
MEDLLKIINDPTFKNPIWWISTVVVGILVNLFSAYAKYPFDKIIARYSESKRKSNEALQILRDKIKNNIIANPAVRNEVILKVIDLRIGAVLYLVLSIIPLFLSISIVSFGIPESLNLIVNVVGLVFNSYFLQRSFLVLRRAEFRRSILRELNEIDQTNAEGDSSE